MNVLVTGASRGIGRSIALTLADDHDIAVNYRTSEEAAGEVVEAATKRGSNAVAVGADVRDPEAVESMIADVVDALGGLDALVNNAGIVDPDLAINIASCPLCLSGPATDT